MRCSAPMKVVKYARGVAVAINAPRGRRRCAWGGKPHDPPCHVSTKTSYRAGHRRRLGSLGTHRGLHLRDVSAVRPILRLLPERGRDSASGNCYGLCSLPSRRCATWLGHSRLRSSLAAPGRGERGSSRLVCFPFRQLGCSLAAVGVARREEHQCLVTSSLRPYGLTLDRN